jgi:medium-chain acyl-[acyl-carrier-protein] hydrolase
MRLVCFPPAGAGASWYAGWAGALPAAVVPVQLPGRENRLAEPAIARLDRLVERLASELRDVVHPPYALFGHSMGALVAWRLAVHFAAQGMPGPERLYVSAQRAPQLPGRRRPLHALPDAELLRGIRKLGGTPPEVLEQPELVRLLLPALRADFAIAEGFVDGSAPALHCPIVAFGGRDDPEVTRKELLAWCERTRGPFRLVVLAGDHFAPRRDPRPLLTELASELRAVSHQP